MIVRVLWEECLFCVCQVTELTFSGVENPLPDRPREKEEPVVRETNEAIECHLSDLLQQLTSVNASKPSERGLVRQGECYRGLHIWGRQGILASRALRPT